MREALAFTSTFLALAAGCLGLGAFAVLFAKNGTRALASWFAFASSMCLLDAGFLLMSVSRMASGIPAASALTLAANALQFLGVAITVAATPYLVAVLTATALPRAIAIAHAAWVATLAVAGALWFTGTETSASLVFVNAQMAITVVLSLAFLFRGLASIRPASARGAIRAFFALSAAFVPIFALDILVTDAPSDAFRAMAKILAPVDDLSIPLYTLILNVGLFRFAARSINPEPLVERGKITEACRKEYGLSTREAELVERLLDGGTNQEIADSLFISKKTVENHLYSIYQKMAVKSRVQLIRCVQNRSR